jgi:hypothetical protein
LLFPEACQLTKHRWKKQYGEQILKQSMVVLLTLSTDCSLVTSKSAHLSPYLPSLSSRTHLLISQKESKIMSLQPVTSLRYAACRETIERMSPTYCTASLAQKGLLLDTVVAVTGYARKYAIQLLNKTPEGKRAIRRRRPSRYGSGGAASAVRGLESNQIYL